MKYIGLLFPLLFILLVGCADATKEIEEQNVTLTISAAASFLAPDRLRILLHILVYNKFCQ
ncbi:hypothetical protein [Robertmurraya kyonggiensis]|uniref:Uncharacterized protein n=1 Tax=Robertmurraya kyonggiensis TaxID=1037680 RepID=A0A4U1D9W0_9BACI|nr:hypothetical protein [Robertmurraya kyonggiensis]TKC19355.1 hypothetical protein FA727_07395 [Robertmurraya kyonggiensis]